MNNRLWSRILAVWMLCAALLAPTFLFAQPDITGKSWTRWDQGRQEAYLRGFYAGLKVDRVLLREAQGSLYRLNPRESDPLTTERYKQARREHYSRQVKYDFKLLRQLVDVFYTHPDNLSIPAPEAIRIVMLRQEGDAERADFLLMRERRKALEGK
ncbi:MAG: hypothetical protein IID13_04255 [Candidatus Marinimicrobia bacterium]|nr:hypothetical protein [Candidatus Neomarinimicrobiota bacterium]